MTNNVLIADDSLTIQKVVAITLAQQPYNLMKCLNEKDLFEKLDETDFDLVLLDINLSEKSSGYDLALEIKKRSPQTAILGMLGTFDTVDDDKMKESGISEKVVKPFESEKFINICKSLLDTKGDDLFGEDETDELSGGWIVDSPKPTDENNTYEEGADLASGIQSSENLLNSELKGWGIEVPPVIGTQNNQVSMLPPVIDEFGEAPLGERSKVEDETEIQNEIESNIDVETDTEIDTEINTELDAKVEPEAEVDFQPEIESDESAAPTSKLISLEELSPEDEEDDGSEDFTLRDLEIKDEVINRNLSLELDADVQSDDFWEVDDTGVGQTVSSNELEATNNAIQADEDELVEKIKTSLGPMIREIVQEFCKEKIEQVAWEIIPDLAENVIRQEVKNIADTVKNTEV